MQTLGVHSEVGKLRTVMVCRPGLAHQRLTPGNAAELLFDDVLWVQEAQKDHYDFVLQLRRERELWGELELERRFHRSIGALVPLRQAARRSRAMCRATSRSARRGNSGVRPRSGPPRRAALKQEQYRL